MSLNEFLNQLIAIVRFQKGWTRSNASDFKLLKKMYKNHLNMPSFSTLPGHMHPSSIVNVNEIDQLFFHVENQVLAIKLVNRHSL